ncbi:MAG: potassium transporter TrkG, partial [bacterium]
ARELFEVIHSTAVRPVRLGKQVIEESTIRSILMFILLYLMIFFVGSCVIVLDCHYHGIKLSFLEAVAGSATTLGNVGPAFGMAGPMNNFLAFPPVSRLTMILLMWLGRLELITVLVIFSPAYWTS